MKFSEFYNLVCWACMVYIAACYILGYELSEDAIKLGAVCGMICALEYVRRLGPRIDEIMEKNSRKKNQG